jgi:hypothetical protein
MANVVDPKVTVIGFGPTMQLEGGQIITPDEFVWGAAGITYKDIGTVPELIELKGSEAEGLEETVKKSLIASAGAGHASMATTPGMWVFLEGNSSKLVDSLFTGVRYGSSLMPSGRRIPVEVGQILVPKGIAAAGKAAEDLFMKTSEANIVAYEKLQERDVPKQDAAKIVQYGHRGGGFMYVPLETLINLDLRFERAGDSVPQEGHDVVSALKDFVHANGMGVVYEARKAAPRTGVPDPSIFHNRFNYAGEMRDVSSEHRVLDFFDRATEGRAERIAEYICLLDKIHRTGIDAGKGMDALGILDDVVMDFNDSVRVSTFSNSPWRLWGEFKRHRTLPQTAESIYHAAEKALARVEEIEHGGLFKGGTDSAFEEVFSFPGKVQGSTENANLWYERAKDSLRAYSALVGMGVSRSDAISVVPRGVKLGIVRDHDLYNLTTGFMSLRLCNDVEPEMRETTEREYDLARGVVSGDIASIIKVKCHYTQFCHNRNPCKKLFIDNPSYTASGHKQLKVGRAAAIREAIDTYAAE